MKNILIFVLCLFLCGSLNAQIYGCTDIRANNFNPQARINNGTCTYDATTVTPFYTCNLPVQLNGTSGLVFFDNKLFSHNDHYDKTLYQISTDSGQIVDSILLENVVYQDVEDMDQDSLYLYLGDLGNNGTGNRNNLHILRISKSSMFTGNIEIDTIWFSYADQDDFSATNSNATDFDCEAFVVAGDSIYLFTKQWNTYGTSLYVLPKFPGRHQAQFITHYHVEGLITSANYNAETKQIVLCGYSSLLQPFLLLLYDYQDNDFFSGNKRKINLNLPFHQVEAIAGLGNYQYYLTNEYISRYEVTIPAKFHKIDLSEFLSPETVNVLDKDKNTGHFLIYPNPAKTNLFLDGEIEFSDIYVYDNCGKLVKTSNNCQQIALDNLVSGHYWLNICHKNKIISIKHFIKE